MSKTYDLNFISTKGEFSLNVTSIAVLNRSLIPFPYLVPLESTVTTTDHAAIAELTQVLSASEVGFAGETQSCVLVEANGSRWILYGKMETRQVSEDTAVLTTTRESVMVVKARMIRGHAFQGLQLKIPENEGQSILLARRARSALDTHQVKDKKRKRSVVGTTNDTSIAASKTLVVTEENSSRVVSSDSMAGRQSRTQMVPATKSTGKGTIGPSHARRESVGPVKQTTDVVPDKGQTISVTNTTIPNVNPSTAGEKSRKDKLKKIIVTLLSLQSISKTSADFKDLYQHTLQAASFALTRHTAQDDDWEVAAMNTSHALIKLFLGTHYKHA